MNANPSSLSLLPANAFNAAHAEVYDRQFEPIRAIKDALHLLLRVRFAHLPPDARILVAGAGTGAEARFLAPIFPGWRFTLADPAEAMLRVAQRHAEAEGFADRCVFHTGFVSTLPKERHHAATSLLVSQFLTHATDRQSYFEDIAARLEPGGLLFNADLCAEKNDPSFEPLMDLWLALLEHSRVSPESKSGYRAAFGRDFAAHGPVDVEAMLARAGFTDPAACYQAVLIRGWIASRR